MKIVQDSTLLARLFLSTINSSIQRLSGRLAFYGRKSRYLIEREENYLPLLILGTSPVVTRPGKKEMKLHLDKILDV